MQVIIDPNVNRLWGCIPARLERPSPGITPPAMADGFAR
jgi:hypothetical protein